MKLVFRYFLYAVVGFGAFTATIVTQYPDMELIQYVPEMSLLLTGGVLLLTSVSLWKESVLTDRQKGVLMRLFLLVVLAPLVFTTGAYIHETTTSWSGGEIHWHADFEVFVDGERHDLISPSNYCAQMSQENAYMCRLNDRVGVTEYHEHNDMRIHLEGTFKHREDATLGAFFETFQGQLTNNELVFPTDEGWVNVTEDSDSTLKVLVQRGVGGSRGWCAIGENVAAEDQCVSQDNGEPAQSPSDYVISPYQRGANLDNIYVAYDDTPVDEALEDVREDDEYRGMGILKAGEGY